MDWSSRRYLWGAEEVTHRRQCGERLKERRLARDMTWRQVAYALGVTNGTIIGHYENDLVIPGVGRQIGLADVLGVHPDELWAFGADWQLPT